MVGDRLKLAVFIDFDNIQIGVKDTLGKEFDVALALEALKERGEVVTKIAYGDWHRAGDQSRLMTQHAVQMVQRNVTPRGDKNGADINLALDALEMAFNRPHINAFAIVGGDSDFIALVEKLKQYDKRVIVVGGRAFTSNILQRNCHEFIAYENLLKDGAATRSPRVRGRTAQETRPVSAALPNVQRALNILAEREVAPQLGLLKSTLLQLDSTFSERDYGAASFLDFMQKMEQAGLVHLRKIDRGYLAELADTDGAGASAATATGSPGVTLEPLPSSPGPAAADIAEAMRVFTQALAAAQEKSPNRPLYMRQLRQALRSVDKNFDERRYGFRGMLDLLHHAQREGWLHLQRDRKGVWRIFATAPAQATGSAPISAPVVEAQRVEVAPAPPEPLTTEPVRESISDAEAVAPVEGVPPAEATVEEAPPATALEVKKARTTRAAKTGQRKTTTRRKSKEATHD
jgi:uncharacterized protein (TIGR00288 family)